MPYYERDGITIYHGRAEDVLPTLQAGSIATTVTSPPYNTLGARMPARGTGLMGPRLQGWLDGLQAVGYADDMDEAEYQAWQQRIAAAVARATRPGGAFFYNHKVRYRDNRPVHPIDLVRSFADWTLRQELIWHRPGAIAFNARLFAPNDERIYWLIRDGAPFYWAQEAASFLSVWHMAPPVDNGAHPCPFPDMLARRCIVASTAPGDLVCDPFMGAGTTLRAAKDLERRAVGIEVEERFCEQAARRLSQMVLPLEATP